MLLLSKSISQLLLPPGIFILFGLVSLIFWKKGWARLLLAFSLLCLWLLSTEPVRDVLTGPLELQYPAFSIEETLGKRAVIVLLGGGIKENAPDYHNSDELSRFAMMRTIYAAKISEQTHFPIYTTGGTPLAQNVEAEGDVMKRWLIWFGIDETNIHSENQANTTWENALLTKNMLDEKYINTIVLVTSAWHMPRAVWCFEAQGLTVIPAPTDYLTKQTTYDIRSFLPRWNVLDDSSQALHEYLGFLWYKLKHPS
ncbi:MAG: YdcF family protein [Ghiorsea sp.]|nr:YdcF family protein [Ghiorsea sp.]